MLLKDEGLQGRLERLWDISQRVGLNVSPVVVELCSADTLYSLAASGAPGRFGHWSFGKRYELLRIGHAYGRHRLYEMIIYSTPYCAFILKECGSGEQLLLIAHLLAHSDFFANNLCFQSVSPPALELFSRHAEEMEEYEQVYGFQVMEDFLDGVLSVKEYFQGGKPFGWKRDLLGFLLENSPVLAPWQRRVLAFIKDEMKCFWPQMETRLLNEGWATFWHQRLLAELTLTEAEVVEASRLHAELTAPDGMVINPYRVGARILHQIFAEEGWTALFTARTLNNDLAFVRRYLTEELLQELDIYLYSIRNGNHIIVRKDPKEVKQVLLSYLENGGYPVIVIEDANYKGRGLYLRHYFNGLELDRVQAEGTLAYLAQLWGAPVFLETILGGETCLLQSS